VVGVTATVVVGVTSTFGSVTKTLRLDNQDLKGAVGNSVIEGRGAVRVVTARRVKVSTSRIWGSLWGDQLQAAERTARSAALRTSPWSVST
jgi:hypothetical protein